MKMNTTHQHQIAKSPTYLHTPYIPAVLNIVIKAWVCDLAIDGHPAEII